MCIVLAKEQSSEEDESQKAENTNNFNDNLKNKRSFHYMEPTALVNFSCRCLPEWVFSLSAIIFGRFRLKRKKWRNAVKNILLSSARHEFGTALKANLSIWNLRTLRIFFARFLPCWFGMSSCCWTRNIAKKQESFFNVSLCTFVGFAPRKFERVL